MIEVEVKLPVFRRPAIEQGLRRLGFIPGHLIKESDTYFTSDFHDFMGTDEALRIRESENLSTTRAVSFLTYKGPKLDSVSNTRKELETEVADGGVCRNILLSLGYRELAPVRKLRVDQVEGLGSFLELEMLVEQESERPDALKKIEAILHDLDCRMEDTTRYSYLFMLQKQQE